MTAHRAAFLLTALVLIAVTGPLGDPAPLTSDEPIHAQRPDAAAELGDQAERATRCPCGDTRRPPLHELTETGNQPKKLTATKSRPR